MFGIGSLRGVLSPSLKSILQSAPLALCAPARQSQRLNKKALAATSVASSVAGRSGEGGRGGSARARYETPTPPPLRGEKRRKRGKRTDAVLRVSGRRRRARFDRRQRRQRAERRGGCGGGYSFSTGAVSCGTERVRVTLTTAKSDAADDVETDKK